MKTTNLTIGAFPIFMVFLVLKLTKVVDWSWWWVTSPLWISGILFLLFFILMVLLALIFQKKL